MKTVTAYIPIPFEEPGIPLNVEGRLIVKEFDPRGSIWQLREAVEKQEGVYVFTKEEFATFLIAFGDTVLRNHSDRTISKYINSIIEQP